MRCTYCDNAPVEVEHMPPMAMFKDRHRLNGLEFACCKQCNQETSKADLVAAFFARFSFGGSPADWRWKEARRLGGKINLVAPEVMFEFKREHKTHETWLRNRSGIFERMVAVKADGKFTSLYMDVFAAKLGMALYSEHVGEPLPLSGGVFSMYFFNAGLAAKTAENIIKILPIGQTLKQGKQHATEQFAYRYNCDGKSVMASLSGFHSSLHILNVATSMPELIAEIMSWWHLPNARYVRPGELLQIMPKRKVDTANL
jgi:hypothetical protein